MNRSPSGIDRSGGHSARNRIRHHIAQADRERETHFHRIRQFNRLRLEASSNYGYRCRKTAHCSPSDLYRCGKTGGNRGAGASAFDDWSQGRAPFRRAIKNQRKPHKDSERFEKEDGQVMTNPFLSFPEFDFFAGGSLFYGFIYPIGICFRYFTVTDPELVSRFFQPHIRTSFIFFFGHLFPISSRKKKNKTCSESVTVKYRKPIPVGYKPSKFAQFGIRS